MSAPATASCAYCKKHFVLRLWKSKYCSRRCYLDHRSAIARPKNTHTCDNCGKEFYREAAKITKKKIGLFCSRRCFGQFKTRPELLTCPKCGGKKAWGGEVCRSCWAKSLRLGKFYKCKQCGKPTYRSPGQVAQTNRAYGIFCSKRCTGLYIRGSNNLYYVNGQHASRYPPEFWTTRPSILKREKNRCFLCSRKAALDVHHINGRTTNNHLWNLVALCRKCHYKQHEHTSPIPMGHRDVIRLANQLYRQLSKAYGYKRHSLTSK